MTVGARIRERRHALNLSQAELAERLGVIQQAVSNMENGYTKLDGLTAVAKLSAALEFTPNELVAFLADGNGNPLLSEAPTAN